MSNLKIFSAKLVIFVTITAIFFQLLVLLYDLVNNVPKSISMSVFTPIPTSQLDYNLSLPNLSTDLASPTNEPPNDELGSVIMTSDIVINAVNPGYNTESGKNSGELIELKNLSDEEISLDNIAIIYISSQWAVNLLVRQSFYVMNYRQRLRMGIRILHIALLLLWLAHLHWSG